MALGIFLAWWLSMWAHARLSRLEVLKPLAILQESPDSLLDELKKIKGTIGGEISGRKQNIEEKAQ